MNLIQVSYLQHVFHAKREGVHRLHQSKITKWAFYERWEDFTADFPVQAVLPRPAAHKHECYGMAPTIFAPGPNRHGEHGHWRTGELAASVVTVFLADLDNQFDDRPMITRQDVADLLDGMGLQYLLAPSFSFKPERHKVRIICPISRDMTPDEAFKVFTVFNYLLGFQLDGSIYDPGDFIYGPPQGAELTIRNDGVPLDVDTLLAVADDLPDEAKAFVQRSQRHEARQPTPEEQAMMEAARANPGIQAGVSIHNPMIFNPTWLAELQARYVGGSRNQTVLGLMTKAWIKSGMTLTAGDLTHLQAEMDFELGGYLSRTYGRAAMARDVKAVMNVVGNQKPYSQTTTLRDVMIEKERARLSRRMSKNERI